MLLIIPVASIIINVEIVGFASIYTEMPRLQVVNLGLRWCRDNLTLISHAKHIYTSPFQAGVMWTHPFSLKTSSTKLPDTV